MENDLTLKNSSSSILAQPNQPSPFSFSFSRAGLLRRPVPTACPQLHRAAHSVACSLGPAAPFPHRPATARGPAGHPRARTDSAAQLLLRCGLLGFTRVARPLSLSLAAHCPHLSAPFFFFPFFFLSFPFFTAGAFLSPVTTDGKPSAPSPAYGKRPIHRFPSLFSPPAGLYNPEQSPASIPILCSQP